ncbi:MAG: hypothetical protein AABX05_04855 [Nanoarchaeota archaeon]
MDKCSECEKEFSSAEGLSHHMIAKHDVIKKKFVMNKRYYWYIGLAVAVLGIILISNFMNSGPGKYDGLAQCLADKKVTFYGAFWCSHCAEQKQLFGKSAKLLPYVECSTPDGKGQTPLCIAKKIEGYPTWEFEDGSRIPAVITPESLAAKTGCPIE